MAQPRRSVVYHVGSDALSIEEIATVLDTTPARAARAVQAAGPSRLTWDRLRKALAGARPSALDPRRKVKLMRGWWYIKYPGGNWIPYSGLGEPK